MSTDGFKEDLNMRVFIFCLSLIVTVNTNDFFYESFKLEQVNNDQVYGFFNFTTTWKYDLKFEPQHYRLFPRSIGQLISKYNIAELHFTMTQGLWRYEHWGYPYAPSPTGAQLWVWFHKDTENVDKNWIGFTNALSGLFCASLNFMNKGVTANPQLSFRPTGLVKDGKVDTKFLRYAALSRETPCTENLTPWLKLLPCGSVSGPAFLLNPRWLQHSRFLSIGLHFKHSCVDDNSVCYDPFVNLQQHVSIVYDIRRFRVQKKFSIKSLFGKNLKPACPLAKKSDVFVKTLPELSLSTSLTSLDNGYHHLDLLSIDKMTNLLFKWNVDSVMPVTYSDNLISHCYVIGLGLDGGLKCSLTNNLSRNLTVVFFQVLPWFLHTQLHTLTIEDRHGNSLQPLHVSFTPGVIRQSPHRLELVLNLAAWSNVNLQILFTRGFLTWTEHPPDANHGFYINPTVVTVRKSDLNLPEQYHNSVYRIYSESLLISIPVPDFSMPYNVICLVCTVIAISFGTFYNITAKRMQLVSVNAPHPIKLFLNTVIEKLKQSKLFLVLMIIVFGVIIALVFTNDVTVFF